MSKVGKGASSGLHRLPVFLAAVLVLMVFPPVAAGTFGSGTISGKATDVEGNPLANVCVEAFASNGNSTGDQTDANGEYTLKHAETRDYRILFSRCGNDVNIFDEWYDDKPTREDATPVAATDGADTPGIDVELATAGSFSGKVLNGSGGPHWGTCVTAYGGSYGWASEGRTDASGNYRVVGLKSGNYKVGFRRCGDGENVLSEFYPDKEDREDAATISVTAGSDTPGINAELAPGGAITGTYQAESSVAPVACFGTTSIYDSSGNKLKDIGHFPGTGVNTTYRFNRLKTGYYRVGFNLGCGGELDPLLVASWSDFFRGKGTLEDATPIYVTQGSVRTGINSLAFGGASISGTVTDSSGQPLDDICVDTYDSQGNLGNFGRTGPDGGYELDQFTPGAYRLKFSDCLNPDSSVISEFYDDKADLADAVPVSLAIGQVVSGIDAALDFEPEITDPDPEENAKAAKLGLKAKGPIRVKRGKKATYRVRISNSGNGRASGVKLRVKGKGVRFGTTVGQISAGGARTIRVKLRPKRPSKSKVTFTVTSRNAGGKSVKKRIAVRK